MTAVRRLREAELAAAGAIDVSDEGELVYRMEGRELRASEVPWRRSRWDAAAWADAVRRWSSTLRPDVWLGAFTGDDLVGLASLRHRLGPSTAQLTTLHVDRAHRRRGVAAELLAAAVEIAAEQGAAWLYVSSAPTESAVGFYLRQGFEPAAHPDPGLLALEPDDIHMVRAVDDAARPDQS